MKKNGVAKKGRRVRPDLWVSASPNGIGHQKPNHYGEMAKVVWANKKRLPYAWKVLTKGVCDGCALGVAGLHDWTIDGIHLCTTRLRLLELATADVLEPSSLPDVASLRELSGEKLRGLGRLGHPLRRRRGEATFSQITWEEALSDVSGAVGAAPDRTAIYLTSRGLTNEVYYAAGKAARAMGVASIDSAARVCHAPSTLGLKSTVGVSATTCSYQDVIESDLIVLWGSNPANNQPVFMKYLYLARKRGCRVVVINPYLEPGLERYWVPSNIESAMFGTKMCDLHVPVRPGGDVALVNATLKLLIARGAVDQDFIESHTEGFAEMRAHLETLDLDELLEAAGLTLQQVEAFADEYAQASSAILVWSMGITQHRESVDGVRAIVNMALARGNVGRDGAGLMPIRGHSGVQGGAEMGAYATAFPGGIAVDATGAETMREKWGFDVPLTPGLTADEMIDAADREELDVLWSSGGNFMEVLPDPVRVERALGRVPLRVHQDIVLSSQMLVDGDDVIVLPVRSRYEQEGGGTETTTERRVAFSPEIPRDIGEAMSEWRLFAEIARRACPDLAHHFEWATNQALRAEIASVVPVYAGIENLHETGDAIQWGGRHLCVGGEFPTPSGKGSFSAIDVRPPDLPEGMFTVATRRGKQFNSIVHGEIDPLTGASRDAVYMDSSDATRLGLEDGSSVILTSKTGEMRGRIVTARLPARSLQVHWPEGNSLIAAGDEHRAPGAAVPDYNAVVTIAKA